MSDNSGRVNIDQDRIRRAREIQNTRNSSSTETNKERLSVLPPQVSKYDYNSNITSRLDESIHKIELILIEEGQHDKRFNWGDYIKYTPHEVAAILRKHSDEL